MSFLTEAQAFEKACHKTLHCTPVRPCIGSSCMAWRWRVVAAGDDNLRETKHGYCGLASRPEIEP